MQTAQLKMYEKKTLPLGLGHDFDVQTSGVAYWDGTSGSSSTSNCTPTKITTEAHVLPGFEQALLLTNSAAGGYSRSEVITVSPSQPVYVGVLLKLGAGTSATLKLYNVDGAAYFGDETITYSGEQYALVEIRANTPAGCNRMQVEIGGTGAADTVYVQGVFGPYMAGMRYVELQQSWLDETYKLRLIRPMRFKIQVSSNVYDYTSRYWNGDLRLGEDYQPLEVTNRAINPYSLPLNDVPGIEDDLDHPIWIHVQRSLGDTEPLDSEAATTTGPLEYLMSGYLHQVALALQNAQPNKPRWAEFVAETRFEDALETVARSTPQALVRERRVMHIRA